MKKIYASMLVLAMGTCITAGARTYQRADISADGVTSMMRTVNKLELSGKTVSKVTKVKTNAAEEWNNLGQGIFIDAILGLGQLNVTVEESASTAGYYRVPDAFTTAVETANPFLVDATDPNYVLIPDQEVGVEMPVNFNDGTSATGPLTILSYSQFAAYNDIAPEDFMAAYPQYVITMENGVINMPAGSILGVIDDAVWMINKEDMVLALPGAEYVPEWGEIMTGQMLDSFFGTMFGGEPQECEVLVQKNNKVDGVYRIIDPWYKLFDEEAPDAAAGYYFYIDASNPDCVVVPYQSSGVTAGSDGLTYIMSYSENYESIEAFLASELGQVGNITMDVETRTINMTTTKILNLKDGTTSTASPLFFYWPDTDPEHLYFCANYNTPGWIKIPDFNTDGISSVAVDSNNAKAEYYNIQGIRVDNPIAGQLYIVKKGNEVSKQIIR